MYHGIKFIYLNILSCHPIFVFAHFIHVTSSWAQSSGALCWFLLTKFNPSCGPCIHHLPRRLGNWLIVAYGTADTRSPQQDATSSLPGLFRLFCPYVSISVSIGAGCDRLSAKICLPLLSPLSKSSTGGSATTFALSQPSPPT